jgi:ATP phosphoribosyltransferase regulatory subunit HisZ
LDRAPARGPARASPHLAPDPFDEERVFTDWASEAGEVALELHRYDGVGHYFLDHSLPGYDAAAAALCLERCREPSCAGSTSAEPASMSGQFANVRNL